MIDEKTFTKEWIDEVSNTYKHGKKRSDPELIEKVTKALHLLESLTLTSLDFIFKGGTSLLLLLNEMHRFSIDIDIIVPKGKDIVNVEAALNQVALNSPIFTRYEEQIRTNSKKLTKSHYKVYYNSVLDGTEKYVLLDILFERNNYREIIEKNINCRFIKYNPPERLVRMPSINCILGDKLSAFAPNTTGIPYKKDKELEIIKQLFDVANLFDLMSDIEMVRDTFEIIAGQELEYRGMRQLTYEDVLSDVFNTARIIGARGKIDNLTYLQLETGIKSIKNYVFSENYIAESAVKSASKAAYLSLLLKHGINDIKRYDKKMDLKSIKINSPDFKYLKPIIKYEPEAYFYWCKCLEIIEEKSNTLTGLGAID